MDDRKKEEEENSYRFLFLFFFCGGIAFSFLFICGFYFQIFGICQRGWSPGFSMNIPSLALVSTEASFSREKKGLSFLSFFVSLWLNSSLLE